MIKIGMDKNEIIKKIGHPIQIYEIKDKQNEIFIYRAREFGYLFTKYIKPRLSKNSIWTDSSYYLYFTYNNGKLKEIKSEYSYFHTPIQNYQYFTAAQDIKKNAKDLAKSLVENANTLSPLWIDINDLNKIKIGMTEKNIVGKIGYPAQLFSYSHDDVKKVIYRIREVYEGSASLKKKKFTVLNEKNSYVKEKGKDRVFIDSESIDKNKTQVRFKSTDGKFIVIEKENIELLVLNGKAANVKKMDTLILGTWSPFSYNLIFTYDNGALASIKKYVVDKK